MKTSRNICPSGAAWLALARLCPLPTVVTARNSVLAGAMLALAAAIPAQASLIAQYNFNGNTLDSSGNGYNGVNNGATFVDSNYLSFNGTSNYVSLPSNVSAGLSVFSISLLVKTTQSVAVSPDWQNPTIFGFATGGPGSGDLQIISKSGHAGFYTGLDTEYSYTSGPAINNGNWHNIIMTNTGSLLSLFVDGSFVHSKSVGGALATTPFYVGAGNANFYNPSAFSFAAASIDDVRIWNNVLTNSEIKQVAAAAPSTSTSAVPEASISLGLLALGAGGLLTRRRLKRKA
jgi:hypothetical protein